MLLNFWQFVWILTFLVLKCNLVNVLHLAKFLTNCMKINIREMIRHLVVKELCWIFFGDCTFDLTSMKMINLSLIWMFINYSFCCQTVKSIHSFRNFNPNAWKSYHFDILIQMKIMSFMCTNSCCCWLNLIESFSFIILPLNLNVKMLLNNKKHSC